MVLVAGAVAGRCPAGAPAQTANDPHFLRDFEVSESAGFATIEVDRNGPQDVTVGYFTESLEARPGQDYEHTAGELHFSTAGPSVMSFRVPIIDDAIEEKEESLSLFLSNSAGKTIDFGELTIISNEVSPEDPSQNQPLPADGVPDKGPGADTKALPGGRSPSAAAAPSPHALEQPAPIPTITLQTLDADAKQVADSGRKRSRENSALTAPSAQVDQRPLQLPVAAAAGLLAVAAALLFYRGRSRFRSQL